MRTRLFAITFLLISSVTLNAQCAGTFTFQVFGGTGFFDATVTPAPSPNTTYYWWFDDNNASSNVADPVYTFSAAGVYNVCFSFYDPVTLCGDSMCQMVTVNCAADFTVTFDSSGQAHFDCTTSPGATYYWDFGDGNNSTLEDPNHTYANPGSYYACVFVNDSNGNFCDSACHTVTVTSSASCTADFTWLDTMGYTYFISSTTAGPGAMYYWSFGDGNYSTQQNPSNIYWNPGTYTVCLTVYDSNQVFCDSTCHTITVQGNGGCNADFTWFDSLGYVFYFSSASVGNAGNYYWDFGDGNNSTLQNPSHQYTSVGTYYACLYVYDSAMVFCDSVCYWVQVQTVFVTEASKHDVLNIQPNPADELLQVQFTCDNAREARIIFFDAAGRVAYMESINTLNPGQTKIDINTSGMPQGIYLIKMEMGDCVAWNKIAVTHQ